VYIAETQAEYKIYNHSVINYTIVLYNFLVFVLLSDSTLRQSYFPVSVHYNCLSLDVLLVTPVLFRSAVDYSLDVYKTVNVCIVANYLMVTRNMSAASGDIAVVLAPNLALALDRDLDPRRLRDLC
jgi:hypothetical protein